MTNIYGWPSEPLGLFLNPYLNVSPYLVASSIPHRWWEAWSSFLGSRRVVGTEKLCISDEYFLSWSGRNRFPLALSSEHSISQKSQVLRSMALLPELCKPAKKKAIPTNGNTFLAFTHSFLKFQRLCHRGNIFFQKLTGLECLILHSNQRTFMLVVSSNSKPDWKV